MHYTKATLASTVAALLVGNAVGTPVASSGKAGSVCTKSPYSSYLPLSNLYLAQAYCATSWPQAVPTITKTSFTTKKTTVFATTISTLSPQVVNSTSTVTSTTVTTSTPVSTITSTVSMCAANAPSKRAAEPALASAPPVQALFAQMTNSAYMGYNNTFYSTLCSCIQPSPIAKTKVVYSTLAATVTSTATLKTQPAGNGSTSVATSVSTTTSTTTVQASTTTSYVTTTVAAPTSPTCTSINASGQTAFPYNLIYYGACVAERTDNKGNDFPLDFPPIYTTIAGTLDDPCSALQACVDSAYGQPVNYYSFDLHYLASNQTWECVQYYDGNVDPTDWSVPNSDILAGYGYSH